MTMPREGVFSAPLSGCSCVTTTYALGKGARFMKRIAAVFVLVGATLGFAAPSALAAGPSLCVNAHIDVNGTVQDVNQCLPG